MFRHAGSGQKRWCAKQLKDSGSPSMVTFHCPAHRLDLAIQDVGKKV
jgi:hypothetical protein